MTKRVITPTSDRVPTEDKRQVLTYGTLFVHNFLKNNPILGENEDNFVAHQLCDLMGGNTGDLGKIRNGLFQDFYTQPTLYTLVGFMNADILLELGFVSADLSLEQALSQNNTFQKIVVSDLVSSYINGELSVEQLDPVRRYLIQESRSISEMYQQDSGPYNQQTSLSHLQTAYNKLADTLAE